MAKILRLDEVTAKTGLGKTSVWRREREGNFPRRRKLGPKLVGWYEHELDAWLEALPLAAELDDEPARGS